MDQVTITGRDVLALHRAIQLAGTATGVRFGYALGRTRRAIAGDVEALQEAAQASAAWRAYDAARAALCAEHAVKDADGNPRQSGGEYVIDDARRVDFEAAMAALQAEHGDAIRAREAQLDEVASLLAGEVSISVHRVALADLPESLSAGVIDALMPMIVEPE